MSRRGLQAAVLIPLAGLALLVVRAEIAVRTGHRFVIEIAGYDPRDLLHGHFLRYQYVLRWQGPHGCGASSEGQATLEPECCLCLSHPGADRLHPTVQQITCEEIEPADCDGVLLASSVLPPQRFFIPEDRAEEIEGAVLAGRSAIELTCGLDRRPAVRGLLIDGISVEERMRAAAPSAPERTPRPARSEAAPAR